MQESVTLIESLIASTLRMSIPLILASLGGIFSARCGIVALGLEGMMLGGAFTAAYATFLTENPYIGLAAGIFAGIVLALLHGVMVVKFKIDQVIGGIGLNLFVQGLTTLLMQIIWGNRGKSPLLKTVDKIEIPFIGQMSPLLIVAVGSAILAWYIIYKTKYGLHLRMVGENPHAAMSVGIKIRRVKYSALIITGILTGIAGAYLAIDQLNLFTRNMTAGRGFIALSIDILGRYNPFGVLGGSMMFGFADALQITLQSDKIPGQLLQMIPYVVTLFVVVFAVKYVKPPASMGKNIED